MKGSLNQYLIRITVFLVLILVVIIFLYPTIQTAFLSNIYINILIIFSLFFGLIFNIYNLSKLNNDFKIASEEDWSTEYLDKIISVKIVAGVKDAI